MDKQNTVLYRKYRPQTFSEVFGQEHIVKVLEGSIHQKNIGHAYLFSGPRGTGKTSVARIFAREIGCSENDIIEIDAASNRGVDHIRDLREAVISRPFDSKYKVYIIDEVHMLTKEAFNALLKTLEEPPSHVIFILATTELHKVIPTIISRCQSFTFKSPSIKILKEMILRIVKKEEYNIDEESLNIISHLGNGSFRDTQGVLQKVISYSSDKKINFKEVEKITGAPRSSLINEFIQALNEKNTDILLVLIDKLRSENIDAHIFLQMLVEKIRIILRLRFAKKMHKNIREKIGVDNFKLYFELSQKKNNIHAQLLSELLKAYGDMQFAYEKYIPLELAIFRIFGNNGEVN